MKKAQTRWVAGTFLVFLMIAGAIVFGNLGRSQNPIPSKAISCTADTDCESGMACQAGECVLQTLIQANQCQGNRNAPAKCFSCRRDLESSDQVNIFDFSCFARWYGDNVGS